MFRMSRKKRKITKIDTLIGQSTEIQGNIHFSGGLHVDGSIKGNVIAENDGQSMLSLNECGTIEGEVRVPYLMINGIVMGDVYSGEHVELAAKSRITGNVYYNLIEMAVGAEVNGKLFHTLDADPSLALGHSEPIKPEND